MMNIITTTIAVIMVFGKPTAAIVRKMHKVVSTKKKDKAARKAAMEKYMQMHALDIEH